MEERVQALLAFCGERTWDKKRFVAYQRVDEHFDPISEELLFAYHRSTVRVVGNIYEFEMSKDFKTVYALRKSALFKGQVSQELRMLWQAQDRECRQLLENDKLAKENKGDVFEEIMLPIRKLYEQSRSNYNLEKCRAIESAVLAALRTPVRKSEQ